MTRAMLTVAFLTTATALRAGAAEPVVEPPAQPPKKTADDAEAKSLEPVIPERELEFEVSEQPSAIAWRGSAGAYPQTTEFRYTTNVQDREKLNDLSEPFRLVAASSRTELRTFELWFHHPS